MIVNIRMNGQAATKVENVNPNTMTIREVFEMASYNADEAMVTLHAKQMSHRDLGMTLVENNITERDSGITISAYTKMSNAAEEEIPVLHPVIFGNILYIVSSMTPEEIETVLKYSPESAMCVNAMTGEKNFVVGIGEGEGDLVEWGAEFGEQTVEGKACIILKCEAGVESKSEAWNTFLDEYETEYRYLAEIDAKMQRVLAGCKVKAAELRSYFD